MAEEGFAKPLLKILDAARYTQTHNPTPELLRSSGAFSSRTCLLRSAVAYELNAVCPDMLFCKHAMQVAEFRQKRRRSRAVCCSKRQRSENKLIEVRREPGLVAQITPEIRLLLHLIKLILQGGSNDAAQHGTHHWH